MTEILDTFSRHIIELVEGLFRFVKPNTLLHEKFQNAVEKLKLENSVLIFFDLLDLLDEVCANFIRERYTTIGCIFEAIRLVQLQICENSLHG